MSVPSVYVPLLAPMYERMARTGPLMFTMNAPSYGLDGTTSSNVSSVRPQPELVTCARDRSRMLRLRGRHRA